MSTQVLTRPIRNVSPHKDYFKIFIALSLLAVLLAFSLFAAGLLLSGQIEVSKIIQIAEKYYNSSSVISEEPKASLALSNQEVAIVREDVSLKISQAIANHNPQVADSVKLSALISSSANQYNIDAFILSALIHQESKFNNLNFSSQKIGLFMISPAEAQVLATELKLPFMRAALYNPSYNIQLGAYKLSRLIEITKGDIEKALVAFKAGEFNNEGYSVGEVDPSLLDYKEAVLADAKKFSA